ncbi:MAG: DUF4070 domain-containing protein, partial [Spirochaetota bacterium]
PRYAALTPFPGTDLFDKLDREGRILTKDWSFYDCQHIVFQPKNMSQSELQDILHKTWEKTYAYNRIFKRLFRKTYINKAFSVMIELGFKRYSKRIIRTANYKYDLKKYLN